MARYILYCFGILLIFKVHCADKSLAHLSAHTKQCKVQKLELSSLASSNNVSAKPKPLSPTKNLLPYTDQKDLLVEVESLFKKQENNLQLYWSDIKATLTPPQPTLEEQKKEFEEQARQLRIEKFNTFANTTSDCFDAVSTIFYTFGRPKTAAKIQNFGAASFKIASSLNAIIEGSSAAGGASLINPYVGLTMGVCSLIGLFQEPEENNGFEVLMDAMYQYTMALSRQMQEQFEFTMQRFDHVENKIDQYGMAMLQEFFALHQKQDYSLEKLFELRKDFMEQSSMLQGSINHINESLAQKYSSLTANLEALRTEKINEIVHNALHDSLKVDLPLEKFDKHVDKLYTKATVRALEAHLTGGNVDISNYEAIANALTSQSATKDNNAALHQPAYNNINLIRRYANQHCNDNTPTLANPLIWIQCSDTLTTMLQQKLTSDAHYPSSANNKQLLITMLKQLHAQGTALTNFVKKIHDNNYVEKIAEQYQQTIKEINTIFGRLLVNFEQEKTKKLQEHYQTTCTSENANISLSVQKQDYEKQKQTIRTMYSPKLQQLDVWPEYKRLASFTYQGKNITGTFHVSLAPMLSFYNENNDWSFCNSLLRRSAQEYETSAKQDIQNKINKHLNNIQSYASEQNKLLFNLFELSNAPVLSHSLSSVMYPDQANLHELPILPLPNNFKISDYYLLQEQQARGTIRHEYAYDDKHFYINSYFISNQGIKTLILSAQTELDSTNSPHLPYDHAFNYWHGGYFAQKNDLFQYNATYSDGNAFAWSGYIPPLKPYVGLYDTWHNVAQIISVDNQDNNASAHESHAQLKREFNKKIIEQLAPGTMLHAALKRLDAQCKLIDSLLALTYPNDYQDCNVLRAPGLLLKLTDEISIKQFLLEYNNPQSNLASSNLHLPHHLTITNELVSTLCDKIKNIPYKPLHDLQNTLNGLSATLHMVEAKAIIPKALPIPNPNIEQKDQEIATLRAELQQGRNEIKELTEKVNLLLTLLTQDKK